MSAAGALLPLVIWWVLFGLVPALIAEAVVLGLALVQGIATGRLASRRR
jgi:hypothetical protein